MFNSWLIQAQGNCKKLTAFWKNSLRRFSQGHCFGKKNRNSFLLNSWDLCVPTAAGHFLPFIHLSFCLFSLLTVPHSQPRLVYWGGGVKLPHPPAKAGRVADYRHLVAAEPPQGLVTAQWGRHRCPCSADQKGIVQQASVIRTHPRTQSRWLSPRGTEAGSKAL